ncbi:MAG TPA: endonuclease MutS2, partial [Bacteroidetes bacterium]|nr:endonuclease MutS2 [Bacteroidota bacterium]
KRSLYPAIAQLSKQLVVPDEIKNIIDKILDEKGEIKPGASHDLMRISKMIRSKHNEINREFNSIAITLKSRGLLSDTVETYRNGRRVLTLPVENKRKIKGIIHDESATGKTVYIEPEKIIGLNNELYDLELEYKKEIYKILKEVSNQLRPFIAVFYADLQLIQEFDIIAAKAKLALEMDAIKPILYPKPQIHFIQAYHPLLYLKNKNLGQVTVPFDMKLSKGNRVVVISGPNAGGKSITLKTVGLLQLMTQAGFLIPAKEQTKMGIFTRIFTDIGDQQSLEDDLSTYSSRLKNMKMMLENADQNSLVLIDEFGSGTDPKIGGAIAEAILRELHKLKTWAVITTHYTNIKIFAFKTKGIVNAAMHFDKKNLIPTYNFVLGKPGSSFAYEIAQNIGLNKRVLNYARFKAGKNIKKIEELLVELQSDKAELEEKLLNLRDKEFKLDKLMSRYESMYKDLDFKKKKLKLEKKQLALIDLNKNTKQVQNLIKEIQENRKIEKAKELAKKLEEDKMQLIEESKKIQEDVLGASKNDWKNLNEGDYIKLRNSEIYGKVVKLKKKSAEIETGNMKLTVPLTELQPANKPIESNSIKGIKTSLHSNVQKLRKEIQENRKIEKAKEHAKKLEEDKMQLLEGGFDRSQVLSYFQSQTGTLSDILQLGMMLETQALDLYTRLSRKAGSDESRQLFEYLAKEETQH